MKYVVIALVFAFIGLGAIEQQIQSGIQKRSKIKQEAIQERKLSTWQKIKNLFKSTL